MANGSERSHVYVGAARWRSGGTIGGIFRRRVGDDRFEPLTEGLPETANVQAITVHPGHADVVYAGTDQGPFRSTDGGERWERLSFPNGGIEVWSILVHPQNPRLLYAGTSPVGVYRSQDGGDSWTRLPNAVQPDRVKMSFACRVMRLAVEPTRPEEVYATLEVGGVMRSLDGGEHWDDCSADLVKLAEQPHLKSKIQSDTETEGMLDGHAIAVTSARPGTVYVAVRMGLFRSNDRGGRWEDMEIGRFSPLTYGRDIRVSPHDPNVFYACLSPAAQSQDGSLYRSDNCGGTWTRFDHGIKAESTMMAVALHPRDPAQVHCVSRYGQVFGTTDGGRTWSEHHLPEGVGDVYAIACG